MCRDCGCSDPERAEQLSEAHKHAHEHGHPHVHGEGHSHAHTHQDGDRADRRLTIERSLTELNDHLAMHNRERFSREKVAVVNLMSSPGAGKTRLLELTLGDLAASLRMAVIVGDLATENDARRLRESGAPVVAITTGTMCHLEADMIGRACDEFDLASLDLLFIENVGNLVCPASFDLGEGLRVVLMSVTEGEDKPLKYPPMFKLADVVLVTKTDLTDAAGTDLASAIENIRQVAPQAQVIELSARTGDGLDDWYEFLEQFVNGRPKNRHNLEIVDGAAI
jgi:hydrogenase nickel incorporation protein HypB